MKHFAVYLDTAGLFAARIADVAFAAAAITGRDLRVDRAVVTPPRIALARTQVWDEASAAMQGATPLSQNGFKTQLFQTAIYRTVLLAAGQMPRDPSSIG